MSKITPEMINGTRLLVSEQYSSLSDNEIKSILESRLSTMEADVGQILQGITGVVGALAPAIGGMVGGQTGRIIGTAGQAVGALGNIGANIARGFSRPTTRQPVRIPAGRTPTPVTNRPSQPSRPGTPNAAGQLARMLYSNPQVMQSIGSMLMGRQGRSSVPVTSGGPNVPVGAYANMLGQLINRSSFEAMEKLQENEQSSDWLYAEDGNLAVEDITNPAERADALIELLNLANSIPDEDYEQDEALGEIEEENYTIEDIDIEDNTQFDIEEDFYEGKENSYTENDDFDDEDIDSEDDDDDDEGIDTEDDDDDEGIDTEDDDDDDDDDDDVEDIYSEDDDDEDDDDDDDDVEDIYTEDDDDDDDDEDIDAEDDDYDDDD